MQKRINKYFGQLAVQMGLLSVEQVKFLLEKQREREVKIEDILVYENLMAREVLQNELAEFKMLDEADQGVFTMRWVSKHLKQGNIFEAFIEQTLKLWMRLAEMFVLEGECNFNHQLLISNGVVVQLALSGDFHCSYYLNMSENLAMQMAYGMIDVDEDSADFATMHLEAAGEFVNIACGNAIGKLDGVGFKFEMTPPKVKRVPMGEPIPFKEGEEILCIPILVPEGEMELAISGSGIFSPVES
jgi:CheY-specific phosphatase CheX